MPDDEGLEVFPDATPGEVAEDQEVPADATPDDDVEASPKNDKVEE